LSELAKQAAVENTEEADPELDEIIRRAKEHPGVIELMELLAKVPRVPAGPVKLMFRYSTDTNDEQGS